MKDATPDTQPIALGKKDGKHSPAAGSSIIDDREIDHLKHDLEKKEVNLKAIQKQVKNLESYFDEQNDQKNPKVATNASEKKDL